MKELYVKGEKYEADKIEKTEDGSIIIGYINNEEVFKFKGINNLLDFKTRSNKVFNNFDKNEITLLKEEIIKMKKDISIISAKNEDKTSK